MSVRNFGVRLSAAARDDLREILLFTRERWGRVQRERYRIRIGRALDVLAANPAIGQARDDLFLGCRSFRVGPHLIYYQVVSKTVVVARILHERRDATTEVTEPAP